MSAKAFAMSLAAMSVAGLSCTDGGGPAGRFSLGGPTGGTVLTDRVAEAAFEGNRKALEAMLPSFDVDATDEAGRTMLMLASYSGHADTVRMLCEHQADPNLRDASRRTALMYAASGPNLSTVEILLAHGAEVNVTDGEEGWTALMFAAAEGHTEIVRMLLAEGADPDLIDADGESAATFARNQGHGDVVALLGARSSQ